MTIVIPIFKSHDPIGHGSFLASCFDLNVLPTHNAHFFSGYDVNYLVQKRSA